MAIPDFQSFMLPLLKFASDGKEHSQSEASEALSHHFSITESERREMIFSAICSGWLGGITKPASGTTTWGISPTSVARMGSPLAMASRMEPGNPSQWDELTYRSAT